MKIYKILCYTSILLMLVACGGSSNGSSDKNIGVFLDSPVVNIDYRTETIEGVTNSSGEYEYLSGETVTFFVGGLEFPTVVAKSTVTPLDLAETTDVNNSTVVNIIRLLQTLDQDANLDNGLTISNIAKSTATAVDFSLTEQEFEDSAAVTSLIFNAGQDNTVTALISTVDAISHFENSLELIDSNSSEIAGANIYTVYGGHERFSGGISEMLDYTLLGRGHGVKTFNGNYKFFVIANEGSSIIQIDAVLGSDSIYYSTNITSNTFVGGIDTWMNLEGRPDDVFVSMGSHGYILISASQENLTSIEVFGK